MNKHTTGEDLGMDMINIYCENIIRVLSTQQVTLVDLIRCQRRFKRLAKMFQEVIDKSQREINDELRNVGENADKR